MQACGRGRKAHKVGADRSGTRPVTVGRLNLFAGLAQFGANFARDGIDCRSVNMSLRGKEDRQQQPVTQQVDAPRYPARRGVDLIKGLRVERRASRPADLVQPVLDISPGLGLFHGPEMA